MTDTQYTEYIHWNAGRSQRSASALIMIISLLVLLITVAITFLEMVGRQHNSTIGVAAQVKADIAVQQAQAHLLRCFNQTAANPTSRLDETVQVPYSSYYNQMWHREFGPVTDPDGNPFTDTVDYVDGDPMQGQPMAAGTESTGRASTTLVSNSYMVNTRARLLEMMDISLMQLNEQARLMSTNFGFPDRLYGADKYYFSRWHNIEYLDSEFKTVHIDPSLTPAEKADIRRTSRYVLRYTAQALDLHSMQTINNNFPHELGSDSIDRGSGSTDSVHYIRYQNYLRCYGRSIKSQRGVVAGGEQPRRQDSQDPLDVETVGIQVEVGSDLQPKTVFNTVSPLHNDGRIKIERAFRGGDLQWGRRRGNNFAPLSPGHKGRVYTWSHLRSVFLTSSGRMWNTNNYIFTPYGDGMLDDELVASGSGDEVSTPWRVNLLSAPRNTLRAMVYGLNSHSRHMNSWKTSGNPDLDKDADDHNNKLHPTDLLGRDYPEAFPLSLDSGRDVPLMGVGGAYRWIPADGGDDKVYADPDGYEYSTYRPGGTTKRVSFAIGASAQDLAAPGTRLSYINDITVALRLAIDDARRLWDEEEPLFTGTQTNPVPWGAFLYRNNQNQSLIKPVTSSTTPDDMLEQVLREIYRILGEGEIRGSHPAISIGSIDRAGNVDPSGKTLLAGGRTMVGSGSAGSLLNSANRGDWEISAKLSPSANTRAMEYVLNDFMISLFGKANPNYVIGSKDYANIAVDFNGDGKAESTVTGWWNQSDEQVWSWWWDGLGPYVRVDANNEYMKRGGWFRFTGGKIYRQLDGDRWVEIPDYANFITYNTIWLTGNMTYPIKPFAKTGRFFIGRSKLFNGFVRGQVFDILNKKPLATSDRYFVYRIDPNDDDDFSDNHIIIQNDDLLQGFEEY